MKDQRWLWQEQVFTAAKYREHHHYMERHLAEVLVLDSKPINIYDHNIENVVRGRREPMVVFYVSDEDVGGWLNYLNSMLRGNLIAIRIR